MDSALWMTLNVARRQQCTSVELLIRDIEMRWKDVEDLLLSLRTDFLLVAVDENELVARAINGAIEFRLATLPSSRLAHVPAAAFMETNNAQNIPVQCSVTHFAFDIKGK